MKTYYVVDLGNTRKRFWKFRNMVKFINRYPVYDLPYAVIKITKEGLSIRGQYIQQRKSIGVKF